MISSPNQKDAGIHHGHRRRMRRKFLDYGPRFFDTYELLEMLLYHTVPIKDTNPIAKRLLMRFGSLDGVLSASRAELLEVDGIGDKSAELILSVADMMRILSEGTAPFEDRTLDTYDELGAFIAAYIGIREDFAVLLFSFDNNMKLIGADKIYSIDYASGGIKPQAFVDTAVSRGAAVTVVAHNHPYGPFFPTEGDRQTNLVIEDAMRSMGITFLEHYIICGSQYLGFMNHMDSAFAQSPALGRFNESRRRCLYERS